MFNEYLSAEHKIIKNRDMKAMIIKNLGDSVKFTSLQSRKGRSEMLYSNKITVDDMVESARDIDIVKQCAET